MRFFTTLPGLTRWPPADFVPGTDNWQTRLAAPDFAELARAAERAGFHSINVPEHLVVPVSLTEDLGAHWPDAFTVMAFVAGATSRIAVNSMVIVLPLHHPVRLAKAIATLDHLSGGRLMLTFGAGVAPGEFSAAGVDFHRRGRIMNEYLEAMNVLWDSDVAEFHGEVVDFAEVVLLPKPLQRPAPPIFIGGRSIYALRRAARFGAGWFPSGAGAGDVLTLEQPADLPRFMEEARTIEAFADREAGFEIAMHAVSVRLDDQHRPMAADAGPTSTQQVVDLIGELAEFGVTWTNVPPLAGGVRSRAAHLEYLAWAAEDVMGVFRLRE